MFNFSAFLVIHIIFAAPGIGAKCKIIYLPGLHHAPQARLGRINNGPIHGQNIGAKPAYLSFAPKGLWPKLDHSALETQINYPYKLQSTQCRRGRI
tara:strand:- start:124 stop:411 length:288 start_codon:yes stop_codon:yes gene_type:complete